MGKRPKKKVVLVLVEGKTDRRVLETTITDICEDIDEDVEVFFPMIRDASEDVGGDITTTPGVWPRNIEKKIYDRFLYDFFDEYKLYPKDITEIVHLVDMDGAYIEDEAVTKGEPRILYTDEGIITFNVEGTIKRNNQKRENINYLVSLERISVRQKKVKYSIYYFASNLDHFIHNAANLESREKVELADIFIKNHMGNIEAFVKEFVEDPKAAASMSYEESWEFIRQGHNSVQRNTNIDIWLRRLLEQKG